MIMMMMMMMLQMLITGTTHENAETYTQQVDCISCAYVSVMNEHTTLEQFVQ